MTFEGWINSAIKNIHPDQKAFNLLYVLAGLISDFFPNLSTSALLGDSWGQKTRPSTKFLPSILLK